MLGLLGNHAGVSHGHPPSWFCTPQQPFFALLTTGFISQQGASPLQSAAPTRTHPCVVQPAAPEASLAVCFLCRGVGCILYEMATGRPMFPGATVKEELHLIFRLMGKSQNLPQTCWREKQIKKALVEFFLLR